MSDSETRGAGAAPGPAAARLRRGCGYRTAGAVYVETHVEGVYLRAASGDAEAFDRCLFDPPIPVDPARLGATDVGVHLVDAPARDGGSVTHVLDVVGRTHYPDVAGFLAEARAHGVSRRVPATLDFARLAARSRILLVHARAWIENAGDYFAARAPGDWSCPKGNAAHLDPGRPPAMCASLFTEDLEGPAPEHGREVTRAAGDTVYRGRVRPEGVRPRHRYAIFASFPVSAIAVVRDREGGAHRAPLGRARRAALPVHLAEF
jgi:hypothetical protein